MNAPERSGRIINRKFTHFLFPTIMSMVAVSLNEFVDSIIVSHLLGSNAMAMVTMGCPVMLAFAVLYTLLGVGGSVLYGTCEGEQSIDRADRVFTVTFAVTILASLAVTGGALWFLRPLSRVLCQDEELLAVFVPYLRVLILSGLLIVPVQVIINFLPAFGRPGTGTAINITANVVNLLMDYVYIHFLHTNLKGAAMATLTGYAVGMVMVLAALAGGRLRFPFRRVRIRDIRLLPAVLSRGFSPTLNQFGYCIKISVGSGLAMALAGSCGAAVFSLCMQTVSIISIFIAGIIGAMMPIAASLHGQRDFGGMKILLRSVLRAQLIANAVLTALLELFPGIFLLLYNVQEDYARPALTALRIFSCMFLFRGYVMVLMFYYQVSSRKLYAMLISVVDGFAGFVPLALVLTGWMGINGLWTAFPVLSAVMLLFILLINAVIARRSSGKYRGILLLEEENGSVPITFDATIPMESQAISDYTEQLQSFCARALSGDRISALVALAAEEMSVYSMTRKDQTEVDELDILVKIYPTEIMMDFRTMGKPFDISTAPEEAFSNADTLKKIASSVDYVYNIGFNQTRIRIARQDNS